MSCVTDIKRGRGKGGSRLLGDRNNKEGILGSETKEDSATKGENLITRRRIERQNTDRLNLALFGGGVNGLEKRG